MVYYLVEVKELKDEEQFLCVELAVVELIVGMAFHLPADAVEVVLELMSNLSMLLRFMLKFSSNIFDHLFLFLKLILSL